MIRLKGKPCGIVIKGRSFLLTVAFVFQFVYGLFTPFQSYSDEVTLASNRASIVLVDRILIADRLGMMSIVDQGKLNDFNSRLNQSDEMAYKSALGELGLNSSEIVLDVNMSVSRLNGSLISQRGLKLPENIDVSQTRRLVLIINSSTGYNETAFISLRVW